MFSYSLMKMEACLHYNAMIDKLITLPNIHCAKSIRRNSSGELVLFNFSFRLNFLKGHSGMGGMLPGLSIG